MNKNIETKVTNFFIREMNSVTGDLSIFKNEDGNYELFNRYKITRIDSNLFEVIGLYGDSKSIFSNLKNAVTWCIYEKRKKWQISSRVAELDAKISGLEVSMSIIKRLIAKETNLDAKFLHMIKFNEEKLKRKTMLAELEGYSATAKFHQYNTLYLKDQK